MSLKPGCENNLAQTNKLVFNVLMHEMQNAKFKMQNCGIPFGNN